MEMEKLLEIQIKIEYKTTCGVGTNQFNTLQELKVWLEKHPEKAHALGYKKGGNPSK
jgi:hypothetical protein